MSSYSESPVYTEGLLDPFAYGRGFFELKPVAQPAAGANASDTIDGRWLSRLISVSFRLVTDANVANRFVSCDIQDGNGGLVIMQGNFTSVVAGKTAVYSYGRKQDNTQDATGLFLTAALDDFFLEPGRVVVLNIHGVQVGDQLSRIILGYERFPTGPQGYPEGRVGPGGRHQAHAHRPSHHAHRT